MIADGVAAYNYKRVILDAEIGRHTRRVGEIDGIALNTKDDILVLVIKPNALHIFLCYKVFSNVRSFAST